MAGLHGIERKALADTIVEFNEKSLGASEARHASEHGIQGQSNPKKCQTSLP